MPQNSWSSDAMSVDVVLTKKQDQNDPLPESTNTTHEEEPLKLTTTNNFNVIQISYLVHQYINTNQDNISRLMTHKTSNHV